MKVPNSNKALTVLILLLINSCLCEINYQTVIKSIKDQRGVISASVSLNNIKSSETEYNQPRSNESSSNLQNQRQIHHRIKKRSCVSRCGRCKTMCASISPCGRCDRCKTGSYNIPSFNLNTISHVPTMQILNTIRKRQHEQTGTWNTKPINPIATSIQVKSGANGMASVKSTNTLGVTKTNSVIKTYSFVTTTNNMPKTAVNPFKLNIMLIGKNNNVKPATTSARNYFINSTNNTFSKNHNGQTSTNNGKISLNSMKPHLTIELPALLNFTKYLGNCHRKTTAKTTKTTVMTRLETKIWQSTKSTAASSTKTTVVPKKISRNPTSRPKKIIPVSGPKTTVKTSSNWNITKTSAINTKCSELIRHNRNFGTKIPANNSKLNQIKPVNAILNNSVEGKKRKSDAKFLNNSTKIVPSDVKESAGKSYDEKNKVKSTTKTNNSDSNGIKITKTLDSNRNRTYTILGNDNKVKNGNDVVKNAIKGNNPDSQKVNKNNCLVNNNKISRQPITNHYNRNNIDDVKKLIFKTLNKIKNVELAMKKTNVAELLHSNGNESIASTEGKNNNRVLKNNVEKSTAIHNKNVKTVVNTTNADLQENFKNNGIISNKNLVNKIPKEETKIKNAYNGLIKVIKESVTKTKNVFNVLSNKNTIFNEATDVKNTNNVVKSETDEIKTDDTHNSPNAINNKSSPNVPSEASNPPAVGVPDEATKIKIGNEKNRTTGSKKNIFEWVNDVKLA